MYNKKKKKKKIKEKKRRKGKNEKKEKPKRNGEGLTDWIRRKKDLIGILKNITSLSFFVSLSSFVRSLFLSLKFLCCFCSRRSVLVKLRDSFLSLIVLRILSANQLELCWFFGPLGAKTHTHSLSLLSLLYLSSLQLNPVFLIYNTIISP